MPKLTIDGRAIEVEAGTTLLTAAGRLGIDIPTFCFHEGLQIVANCRMCLVELKGSAELAAACHQVAREGMEVLTRSEAALAARRQSLEFLLLNHPVDCPVCDCAGECALQDHYMTHSAQPSRLAVPKVHKAKALPVGPNVMLDQERCINCTRCIRFLRDVTGSNQLVQEKRGNRTQVTVFPGRTLDDPYSLCAVDLCPVGALTSRDFRFKQRAWWLVATPVVCPECATGCSLMADHSAARLYRLRPRRNAAVNGWWACDAGRLAFHRFEQDRVVEACYKWAREGLGGHPAAEGAAEATRRLVRVAGEGKRIAVVVSGFASVETAYAAGLFARAVGGDALYAGFRADQAADRLLRHADANPNRAGVTAVAQKLGLALRPVSELFAGDPAALVAVGSEYALPELPEGAALEEAVVLSVCHDEVTAKATVLLPAPSHYEKEGCFLNAKGVLQQSCEVVRPAHEVVAAGRFLREAAQAMGRPLGYGSFAELRRQALAGLGLELPAVPGAGRPGQWKTGACHA